MPKRTSKSPDVVQNAKRVFDHVIEVTESEETLSIIGNPSLLSQVMAAIGRKGGQIGGKRRLVTMTGKQRSQVASDAAKVRWAKVNAAKAKAEKSAKSRKQSA
jgi:hypothetical protein